MNAKILDQREDGQATCYLCRLSLEDYISALPEEYRDYQIQRGIVNNVYLDHLVDTVLSKKHIPTIVLVIDDKPTAKQGAIAFKSFKILDGLQRTHRLRAIHKTIAFAFEETDSQENYLEWNRYKLSRSFSKQLKEFDSSLDILRRILEFRKTHGDEDLRKVFSENIQWFEIWQRLTAREQVRKMLTLNAGHKPVNARHQLELLFLNLLQTLKEQEAEFDLVRERQVSGTLFAKNRKTGAFHFAHIVTALLSFREGEPIAPSSELIQSLQSSDEGLESDSIFTDPEFLAAFVRFLVKVDALLNKAHPEVGKLWMGREVSLASLFGALGAFRKEQQKTPNEAMDRFLAILRANNEILNLSGFEEQRNRLELSKINFGSVNRRAVFDAVYDLMSQPEFSKGGAVAWAKFFKTEAK